LDVKVARAHFFPRVDLTAGVGYRAFNPKYLFMTPEALVLNAAGELTAPLINRAAIRAEYLTANARQLQSVYDYQRVILDAFTEVINRMSQVENYSKSIAIKRQQLQALEAAVEVATKLYLLPRGKEAPVDYLDVLFAQRDLLEARTVLIDTKRRQLSAIVNAYQALGGGSSVHCPPPDSPQPGAAAPQRLPELPQLPAPREVKDAPELPKLPKEKDAP
jgi:outer membrane protein TolC